VCSSDLTVAHDQNTSWNILHPDLQVTTYHSNWVYGELGKYDRLNWLEFEPTLAGLLNQR